MKVSKEEIIALLTALRRFLQGEYQRDIPTMREWLEQIRAALRGLPVACELLRADDERVPLLEVQVNESVLGISALELCRRLRHGKPPVYVGHGRLSQARLVINPLHLTAERTSELLRRLREELGGKVIP